MTVPEERFWAIGNARQFLLDIMDPRKTPRIPKTYREQARKVLKHYPEPYHMEMAKKACPDIFTSMSEKDRMLLIKRLAGTRTVILNAKIEIKELSDMDEQERKHYENGFSILFKDPGDPKGLIIGEDLHSDNNNKGLIVIRNTYACDTDDIINIWIESSKKRDCLS